jgi:uncharacterized protein (TIGR02145 family)
MSKHVIYLILLLSITSFSFAQTVTIGSQVWTTQNLSTAKFRNGDPIIEAKTDAEWVTAGENGQPAWCYYKNIPANGVKYGKLYNWFAVNDPRGLAPAGFHIPTDEEWTALTNYLGGEGDAGYKMKSTSGWIQNGNGSNSSAFSGLPGGGRKDNGVFGDVGSSGNWWSSTEGGARGGWACNLHYTEGNASRDNYRKQAGFSVRCLKGEVKIKAQNSESFYDDRDGKTYRTVNIGNQTWMASNLAYKPSSGNYYVYNNEKNNLTRYGYLYDWSTACNVCPSGWKLPSNSDYLELTNFLGQDFKQKMMEKSAWDISENASNVSGFSGLPSGMRDHTGTFSYLGLGGYFWTSTFSHQNFSFAREIGKKAGNWASHEFGTNKNIGMSVRCLKRLN